MRRALSDSVALALVASALLAFVSSIRPGDRGLALDLYVLVLGGLAMLAVSRVARQAREAVAEPSRFDEALLPEQRPAERPADLVRLEREVALGTARAFDLHYKLRPVLREIAEHRLRSVRGFPGEGVPEAARNLLGTAGWELLRDDRPPPEQRMAPGMPAPVLRDLVDRLEKM